MEATRPSGSLMARPVLVAAVVAVALGILAMHAISLHGICHQPALAAVTSAMAPLTMRSAMPLCFGIPPSLFSMFAMEE